MELALDACVVTLSEFIRTASVPIPNNVIHLCAALFCNAAIHVYQVDDTFIFNVFFVVAMLLYSSLEIWPAFDKHYKICVKYFAITQTTAKKQISKATIWTLCHVNYLIIIA